ncbi:DUF4365 domain-containing protein [Pectobacterium brasiliense]|uniref:DUF4365 domain-containing protein n=1 Tax=Pectobacterium brasiliense TaxID=180957 RepID=UPI0006521896|nr:DUF4365 domain-containing protein [Pectobacterium brasiliense]KMK82572.1 hypothetical protein KCO_13252 [Pectobacterium brasiliense ICMP 19477]
MTQLPNDSLSQEIGRLAQRALATKIPRAWIETAMSGDSDFGIDYQIQLKNALDQVEYNFYLQLKGTTEPSFNIDGTLSFSFKCSTLNYYHSQDSLVMVAVVNLKDKIDEVHECPIYYLWLDDTWFNDHNHKLHSQDTITLRIPTKQMITTKLDIYEFHRQRFQERIALTGLSREIKPYTDDIVGTISNITNTITDKPFYLKAIEHNGDEPWVENPEGYYPTELKVIENYIIINKLSPANDAISILEKKIDVMSPHERAELWYQKANLMVLLGKIDESRELYRRASSISDKIRYLAGELEADLRSEYSNQAPKILERLKQYNDRDKRILFIKVKCMALIGCAQDAITLINDYHPEYIAAKLVVYSIVDDIVSLDRLIESIDLNSLKSTREKLAIHFIAGRRSYLKANNESIEYDKIIPIYGLPNADLKLLQQSYEHYKIAWNLTEELGYPQDFTLLLDISPLVFSYFNNMQDLFRHFDNILRERPQHAEVFYIYIRLMFNQQKYPRVISLLECKEYKFDLSEQILLFLSYYNINKPSKALDVFKGIADDVWNSVLPNKTTLFCIASRVARELFEIPLSEYYMSQVKLLPDADVIIALSDFLDDIEKDVNNFDKSLELLYEKYTKLGRPLYLAEQLINNLRLVTIDDAEKIIDVASIVSEHHGLSEKDNFKYANSLIKKGLYHQALNLIDISVQKEHVDPNWHFLKALALHYNGESGLAIDSIRQALGGTQLSDETLQFYMQLCIKFGMANEIEQIIIELISKTSEPHAKAQLLIQLFNIYSKDEIYKDKRLPVLRKIGRIVNQDDPDEEGNFLMLVLTSERTDDEEEFSQWQQRLIKYTEKFPNSPRLKKAVINPDAPVEEFIESLNKLTGVTSEQIEWWESNKQDIRNGSLKVPFAMLGYFLKDTRDIFTSWALSKSTPEENIEFKIHHSSFCPQDLFNILSDEHSSFILEETTLLILSELDILENFLRQIDHFAILSTAFNNISTHAQSLIQTDKSHVAMKILSEINNHRSKLKILDSNKDNIIDSYILAVNDKDYILLSDDFYMQTFVLSSTTKKTPANSFNIILFLMYRGVLTRAEVCYCVAKVCSLGIYKPNMSIQLLSDVYHYFYTQYNGEEILQTEFSKVYTSIFSSLRPTHEAASLLLRMLFNTSSLDKKLPTSNVLIILLSSFIEKHPFTTIERLLTLWFIQQCAYNTATIDINNLHESSIKNSLAYDLYKESMCNISPNYKDEELILKTIIDALRSVEKEKRSQVFSAVKTCFIPLTYTALTLEAKYQSMLFNDQYIS